MQAHGVKSQTALQYRMESSLHWAQGHVSFPGCLGTEGLLPGWDVLLLVSTLGLQHYPRQRTKRRPCNPRPFTVYPAGFSAGP